MSGILLGAGDNQCTRPNQGPLCQGDLVTKRGIYTDETMSADLHMTRDDCMRANETIIADFDVMTHQATAPDDDIVT